MTGRWVLTFAQSFTWPLVFGALAWLAGTPPSWWTVVNLLCWFPLMLASIAIHELGHVAVARLVGLEVRRVQLGVGRRLGVLHVGTVEIEVASLPFLGRTFPGGQGITRWRLAPMLVAGPGASLLLAVGLAQVGPSEASLHEPWGVLAVAAGFNGFLAILNGLPWSRGLLRSDGLQLLMLPTLTDEQLAEYALLPLLADFERALGDDDIERAATVVTRMQALKPGAWSVSCSAATVELLRERFDEAARLFESLVGTATSPSHRALALNNLAWTWFMLRDDAHRAAALDASKEALAASPREPGFMNTRGAVLFWSGDAEGAIPLLEAAWLLTSGPAFRGSGAALLTMAWVSKGDRVRASQWLGRVSLRRDSRLRREAEAALS
jgi:hypothetical protein